MKPTGERFIPDADMNPELELEHMHRYSAVAPLLSGKVVLDAACGTGYGSYILARNAKQVIGIDIDPETVAYAKEKYTADGLEFREMSIDSLQFPDAFFDAVISFETIEHVSEELQHIFLEQVRRVLKPDGFFVVSTPDLDVFMRRSHGTYRNPFHIKEYNAACFQRLLEQYFTHVTMKRQGKVFCSVIDGEGGRLLSSAPKNMIGEYCIAVCSSVPESLALGSAFQPAIESIDGRFYFDFGDGYGENCREDVLFALNTDGSFRLHKNIETGGNAKRIRFDPCHFPSKICGLCAVYEDGTPIVAAPLNSSTSEGNADTFFHSNPSYELIPIAGKPLSLTITGVIDRINPIEADTYWIKQQADANALLQSLNRDKVQLSQALEDLNRDMKQQMDAERHTWEEERNALQEERNAFQEERYRQMVENRELTIINRDLTVKDQELSDQIRVLSAQNQELSTGNQALSAQNGELETRNKSLTAENQEFSINNQNLTAENQELSINGQRLTAENKELSTINQSLTVEKQELSAKNRELFDRCRNLETEVAHKSDEVRNLSESLIAAQTAHNELSVIYGQLVETNGNLYARYELLQLQYNAIADSQCWKMTAPLRKILDVIKRTRLGAAIHKTGRYLRVFGFRTTTRKALKYIPKKLYKTKVSSESQLVDRDMIGSMQELADEIERAGGIIYQKKLFVKENKKERVLIVSHELDLTGAPVAVENLALTFFSQGKMPIFISPNDGALRQRLEKRRIPVAVLNSVYQRDLVVRSAGLFSLIVVSTIVGAPIISRLSGERIPVLWWIHEARASYHEGAVAALPAELGPNIRVFCGGPYAQHLLREYCPNILSDQLLYYVPDYAKTEGDAGTLPVSIDSGKTVFAVVGTFEERKGQDIFIQAIRLLPLEMRENCVFLFVGKEYYAPIMRELRELLKQYPDNVIYIPQLNRSELTALYNRMTCLVCASRDDPMPIVVTEAMALSKIIICSENAGSAELIEQADAGIIFRNNDPAELEQCLLCVIEGTGDFASMRKNARRVYEENFSYEVFQDNITRIYDQLTGSAPVLPDGMISVVIPTYNAGEEFKTLLEALVHQEQIPELELVIIDSGSTDGTPELAEQYGAKLIRISQAEFSHSYARNLGAKHASGQYVLFMTQDALPGNTAWMLSMAQPLLRRSAVAVSCREEPRKDCDLLGRFSIWTHSDYMGVLQEDRLLKMPAVRSSDELRKNSQLNDVACMIRRDVFQQFGYRGDYAEDLDLGLRLIEAGYHLALLASAPVIHSHTRSGYYHLKRSLVDVVTLKSILPDTPMEDLSEEEALNRVITLYAATKLYIEALVDRFQLQEGNEAFFQWSDRFFTAVTKALEKTTYEDVVGKLTIVTPFEDEKMHSVIMDMYMHAKGSYRFSPALVLSQQYRVVTALPAYFTYTKEVASPQVKKLIADFTMKHVGQLTGITLASYSFFHRGENSYLNDRILELKKGV